MNVWLLYPDRDFNFDQAEFPLSDALVQDLELDILLDTMARGDRFIRQVARQVLLTPLTDPEVIRYRQEILQDALQNPEVVRALYRLPILAQETKQRNWLGIFTRYPGGILSSAVQLLEMFMGLLREMRRLADEHAATFASAGFRRFFAMVQHELDEAYFAEVEKHLRALKFPAGVLISAEVGPGNEGKNYLLRKPQTNGENLLERLFSRRSPTYSYTLHPRDDHGARALSDLRDRSLNLVANAAAQAADHIDNFLRLLQRELAFYIAALNLAEALQALEEPIVLPNPLPMGARQLAFKELYDPALALSTGAKVVGNDLNAQGKALIFITGANQGGKSTFLRSLGQAMLMMQSGLFVAAESFTAAVTSGVFTHFKREEDATMRSGKFDEELSRMSTMVTHLQPHALVLFNESFSATNEREGAEIARQIVQALLEGEMQVAFVTHQYELARRFYEDAQPEALFLRADRQADGRRTFRLKEGEPLPTSFGKDIYQAVFSPAEVR